MIGRDVAPSHWWTLATGAAFVAGAWWLRNPDVRYLAVAVTATVGAAALAVRLPPGVRRWGVGAAVAALLFAALMLMAQHDLGEINDRWEAFRAQGVTRGLKAFQRELSAASQRLQADARQALNAPHDEVGAFRALHGMVEGRPDYAVVLYRDRRPIAWAGRSYVATDTLVRPVGAVVAPFYVVLYATATSASDRAVATVVVDAVPPADRIVDAIGDRVARDVGLHAIDLSALPLDGQRLGSDLLRAPVGDPVLAVRAEPPGREEAEYRALERVRAWGAVLLAIGLLLYVIGVWRCERTLVWRLLPLGVSLTVLALAPLSTFSSASVLFDPTVYYTEIGGPFTASVGALAVAAGIVLLGLLLVLRSAVRVPPRWFSLVVVLAVMGGGPTLLRMLAQGVEPLAGGVSVTLWLAWELALFLAAATLLVAAAAGNVALGRLRVLPWWLAPMLAAIAAALGPAILEAPGNWPKWYTLLWVGAIGAFALARRSTRLVLAAATVAALGAVTLTWNAGVRGRAALAERDVQGLGEVDSTITGALDRLGAAIAASPPPRDDADLMKLFMSSDLVETGYPVELSLWTGSSMSADVSMASLAIPATAVRAVVENARENGLRSQAIVPGTPGIFQVLAVPQLGGTVTSVVVGPRTRLIPDDPYLTLLGLGPRTRGLPPYTIALAEATEADRLSPNVTRWHREGGELHGDRLVLTARGPVRAHIEVELRSPVIMLATGVLVVFVDLVVILVIWFWSVVPEGVVWRWVRVRRSQWAASYGTRLTIALFAFFVMPAAAFAVWGYERLQVEDRQSRDLLLRESLRPIAGAAGAAQLAASVAQSEIPLFIYRDGVLGLTSHPLYEAIAPIGRLLPPASALAIGEGREVYASTIQRVGDANLLFGFRATTDPDESIVIGAPARGNDILLDQRRQDLGILLLFTTVTGALAALGLSRIASRSLARPIGTLRTAALAIAAGEREPPLAAEPPYEFGPVFAAFRRMAADLSASRQALESAQQRTAAVLRNVASGVVALRENGIVTLANPRAEALLARPLPPGTPIAVVSAEVSDRAQRFAASEGADEEEFELAMSGRQLQARLTRLGAGGIVLTVDDVTELARAQRVLAWGEMARQVAHEIKNPLTPIRLGVQHLKRAFGDARGDFGQILDRNAQRILAEIDRLDAIARGFSRYGTPMDSKTAAVPIDVLAVARDVVDLERMGRDDVEWHVHAANGQTRALARDDELREVLLNLLENARQAGAKRVDVRLTSFDGRLRVEVEDDGRGIAPDVLPRLFEPHFSTRTSGSGLGLAISRQLVESWGGRIVIESAEGRGTSVTIDLTSAEPS
ncbi:MAG TPA: ATP-binding protein [Gemmatimonadaceae bacterium]|nr:ATP-binding protein [Gemmatimonadaceae bacterium]